MKLKKHVNNNDNNNNSNLPTQKITGPDVFTAELKKKKTLENM